MSLDLKKFEEIMKNTRDELTLRIDPEGLKSPIQQNTEKIDMVIQILLEMTKSLQILSENATTNFSDIFA